MAQHKYLDYDGLVTLAEILKDKFENINALIDNVSTSPIDLEDITWDNLLGTTYLYINGTQYITEVGMTWNEWINSQYNPGYFTITGSNSVMAVATGMVIKLGSVYVKASDTIVSDGSYTFDGLSGQ